MLRGKKYKIIKSINSFLTILILIIMIGTDVYSQENKKYKVCKLLGSALDIGHNFIKIHYKLCPMSRADPKFTTLFTSHNLSLFKIIKHYVTKTNKSQLIKNLRFLGDNFVVPQVG